MFGEIGSKHDQTDAGQLIAQANDCFEAGAEIVIVEGYELVSGGQPKRELIDALRRGIDPARTLYELPGPWISGINASEVQDLKKGTTAIEERARTDLGMVGKSKTFYQVVSPEDAPSAEQ